MAEEDRERHSPKTLEGRAQQMFFMPENLSDAMVRVLQLKEMAPGALKRNVAQYYGGKDEHGVKMLTGRDNDLEAVMTVAAANFAQDYGAAYAVLYELRQKMGQDWKPKSVLDIGLGPAAGMVALNEVFSDVPVEEFLPKPKTTVILGPRTNTVVAKEIMDTQKHEDEAKRAYTDKVRYTRIETVLPKTNKDKYDLIIANQHLDLLARQEHTSLEAFTTRLVDMLTPEGVLVLVDRGHPNGYERIARAREVLIRPMDDAGDAKKPVPFGKTRKLHFSNEKEKKKLKQELGPEFEEAEQEEMPVQDRQYLHIVAPCSHHGKCPFQQGQLRSRQTAKGSWCSFTQKLARPEYMMQLKRGKALASSWDPKVTKNKNKFGGRGRPGSTDLEVPSFSYLIVQRHTSPDFKIQENQMWPRILKPPKKKKKHVLMMICGPEGGLHGWTVTQAQGKEPYLDARKAKQRDQWALGAKTKTPIRKDYQLAAENERVSRIPQLQDKINQPSNLSTNQRRDLIYADRRKQIKKSRREAKLGGKPLEVKKDEDNEDDGDDGDYYLNK